MRAHSPQLAAELASEIKIDPIPQWAYWEDSLPLAAGYASILRYQIPKKQVPAPPAMTQPAVKASHK